MIVRNEMARLLRQADARAVSIIIGARQVGKTTLIDMLRERLGEPSDVFNLENPLHLAAFDEGYTSFIRNIKTKKVFIDEFQYCKGISSVFKAAYDLNPELKIYATGSSSMEIQSHLKESLAGRKIETVLYPLTYQEWLSGQEDCSQIQHSDYLGEITTLTDLEAHKTCMARYLRYGALPGVPNATDDSEKREYLFGIYQTYIAKDIKAFLKQESVLAFNKAITWLAMHNGSQLNKNNLSKLSGISARQIDRYLDVLTGTYVLALLPPLSNNRGKELTKTPKFFLYDQGIVNSIVQDFRPLNLRPDAGAIREQFVFWELRKQIDIKFVLNYWRTADGKEVDFVLSKDREFLPIEVKTAWKPPEIPSGLKHFLSMYPETKEAAVIYEGQERSVMFGQQRITFIPFHKTRLLPSLLK